MPSASTAKYELQGQMAFARFGIIEVLKHTLVYKRAIANFSCTILYFLVDLGNY
jgi:hypothetical protein